MLISEVAPEADPAGSEKRQEIIPESAMGKISKSGHLHGEKDENVSHRVQPVWNPCTQDAVQNIIDDGNYSVLAVG